MDPGLCPKCNSPVTELRAAELAIQSDQRAVKGFSLSCGHCNTILGVGIDPTAMRNQIAAAVKHALS